MYITADISIAAVDLLQEMTDVEADEDSEDAINAFFDALVSIACWQSCCLEKCHL